MPILLPKDANIKLPKMHKVQQIFEETTIHDIRAHIRHSMERREIDELLTPGKRVAIAVGSRKIDNIFLVVSQVIDLLKEKGCEPFIVPAMGSHGKGTSEGNREVLASFGITEEALGVKIKSDMDVVLVCKTENGIPVYMDKDAYEADMTILINRVKPHTDFNAPIESGLCKMAVIGLGKHIGCSVVHEKGFENFHRIIPEMAEILFRKTNIAMGIAIVENAYKKIQIMETLRTEEILRREPELLEIAKRSVARIKVPKMDILIVEELGKDISGGGMDTNVVGRYGPKANADTVPDIGKIIVLGLSDKTYGNVSGIGCADITTKKVLENIDFEATYANTLAVGDGYSTAYIPLVMDNEEEAIKVAIKMLKITDSAKCKIVKIKNTANLEEIQVSDEIMEYVSLRPKDFRII